MGSYRLGAAAELWQACDRCRRYQTLTRDLARRPLYASNRKLAGRSAPDNLNGSFRKLRTGDADPQQSLAEHAEWLLCRNCHLQCSSLTVSIMQGQRVNPAELGTFEPHA